MECCRNCSGLLLPKLCSVLNPERIILTFIMKMQSRTYVIKKNIQICEPVMEEYFAACMIPEAIRTVED